MSDVIIPSYDTDEGLEDSEYDPNTQLKVATAAEEVEGFFGATDVTTATLGGLGRLKAISGISRRTDQLAYLEFGDLEPIETDTPAGQRAFEIYSMWANDYSCEICQRGGDVEPCTRNRHVRSNRFQLDGGFEQAGVDWQGRLGRGDRVDPDTLVFMALESPKSHRGVILACAWESYEVPWKEKRHEYVVQGGKTRKVTRWVETVRTRWRKEPIAVLVTSLDCRDVADAEEVVDRMRSAASAYRIYLAHRDAGWSVDLLGQFGWSTDDDYVPEEAYSFDPAMLVVIAAGREVLGFDPYDGR